MSMKVSTTAEVRLIPKLIMATVKQATIFYGGSVYGSWQFQEKERKVTMHRNCFSPGIADHVFNPA